MPAFDEINTRASVLMKRGIRLLDGGAHAAALACFDQALELRQQLPATNPTYAFGLAACWLNRGDALKHAGDAQSLAEAIASYDAGLAALEPLPLDADPRFPRRLAIGHQNRGLLRQSQGRVDDAIADFRRAIAVLDRPEALAITDRAYLLAAVWLNLAGARAAVQDTDAALAARNAAHRAIDLATALERTDADWAEVGLKARHAICRTVVDRLSQPIEPGAAMPHDVHEATDAIDDGLKLARAWEQQGSARFRGLACDLFRFGARVYARYQPQFLDEFIRDNRDPAQSSPGYVSSAEMQAAVGEAMRLSDLARRG